MAVDRRYWIFRKRPEEEARRYALYAGGYLDYQAGVIRIWLCDRTLRRVWYRETELSPDISGYRDLAFVGCTSDGLFLFVNTGWYSYQDGNYLDVVDGHYVVLDRFARLKYNGVLHWPQLVPLVKLTPPIGGRISVLPEGLSNFGWMWNGKILYFPVSINKYVESWGRECGYSCFETYEKIVREMGSCAIDVRTGVVTLPYTVFPSLELQVEEERTYAAFPVFRGAIDWVNRASNINFALYEDSKRPVADVLDKHIKAELIEDQGPTNADIKYVLRIDQSEVNLLLFNGQLPGWWRTPDIYFSMFDVVPGFRGRSTIIWGELVNGLDPYSYIYTHFLLHGDRVVWRIPHDIFSNTLQLSSVGASADYRLTDGGERQSPHFDIIYASFSSVVLMISVWDVVGDRPEEKKAVIRRFAVFEVSLADGRIKSEKYFDFSSSPITDFWNIEIPGETGTYALPMISNVQGRIYY